MNISPCLLLPRARFGGFCYRCSRSMRTFIVRTTRPGLLRSAAEESRSVVDNIHGQSGVWSALSRLSCSSSCACATTFNVRRASWCPTALCLLCRGLKTLGASNGWWADSLNGVHIHAAASRAASCAIKPCNAASIYKGSHFPHKGIQVIG